MKQTSGKQATTSRSKSRRILRWAFYLIALVGCIALIFHGITFYRLTSLKESNPQSTAFIDQRAKEAAASGATPRREQVWIPFERISPSLIRAVIAGEDKRFSSHTGVEWHAMMNAIQYNIAAQEPIKGGSTINQQLAKNLFLSSSKTPLRKLHELLLALEMEKILGKRRILEIYLNVIEWGDGIYGAEAAARHYFNTSVDALTDEQAALLAAIIPNPRDTYNPTKYPNRVRNRVTQILEYMPNVKVPK